MSDLTSGALTRDDVLFILGWMGIALLDTNTAHSCSALRLALLERWQPAPPEPPEHEPGVLFPTKPYLR